MLRLKHWAFVIFTCIKLGARRRNGNARDVRKKFNRRHENLDQEQLHPKIFETFSRQYGMCPCSMTLALTLQRKNKEAQVVEIYSTGRMVHVKGMKKELVGQ